MKKRQQLNIKSLGGWNDVELFFSPGWSTGPENGEHNDGLSFDMLFHKKWKVGGFMSYQKVGHRTGGGIIPKKEAIALAKMILRYYKKTV